MKTILVIGIGRFGKHLSRKLIKIGNEVMVVDKDEEKLSELLPLAASAQIGDCTKEEVLRSLGISNFDLCFVCVGSSFQNSLEITSLLKDLGAKYVISKASRDIHIKFLLRNGADEVIDPEKDIAEKLAVRCSANNIFDYIELTKDISIYEIPPAESWIGKSIKEVNFRAKYHVSILATKVDDKISLLPSADYIFRPDEHLMVIGRHSDVERILRLIN
ncbi:MAG: TrkA family potassium uptake protein [Bacillota bacterium]|nr:TrkA family potassium uptake protein [Bacillota bacterium]MDD3297610.1 TrkA family potassium uptake protein [Bacillota bacterium]MDD3851231.1 TrkA family potassium uptake protein [Bacillota bacterium]MDD4707461.1 TrkA family potassium uptake protein [Bacillota bacterium]